MKWLKNEGKRPDAEYVHIQLNVDNEDTGCPEIRFNVRPERWDWNIVNGGVMIDKYCIADPTI